MGMFDVRRTIGVFCHLALATGACASYASNATNTNSTGGSVTPSSGDAVKQGDIILFRSAAPIFQEVYPSSQPPAGAPVPAVTPPPAPAEASTPPAGTAPPTPTGTSATPATPASSAPGGSSATDKLADAADKLSDAAGKLSTVAERLSPQAPQPAQMLCAPVRMGFEVQSISAATKNSPATGSDTTANKASGSKTPATPANAQVVYGVFPSHALFHPKWINKKFADAKNGKGGDKSAPSVVSCTGYPLVSTDVTYQFDASDLDKVSSQRMGFTWGALVVPYKFYLSDKSIKGNPSTLLYAGYEGWFPGVSLALVGSAGLGVATAASNSTGSSSSAQGTTTAPNSTPSASNSSSSTSALYTLATGFIVTFGGSMKAGVMFGWDYQASGVGFKYEGKTWTAISVGTSF
jgi:hypothetical protein